MRLVRRLNRYERFAEVSVGIRTSMMKLDPLSFISSYSETEFQTEEEITNSEICLRRPADGQIEEEESGWRENQLSVPSILHRHEVCSGKREPSSEILLDFPRCKQSRINIRVLYFRPSVLMKKWLTDKPDVYDVNEDEQRAETEGGESPSKHYIWSFRRGNAETLLLEYMSKKEISVTIGTWNVAGRHPYELLDIGEWLCTQEPSDMYVIGFQEVVALNAGNVLGAADGSPIPKWETNIYRTLNQIQRRQTKDKGYAPPSPVLPSAADEHDGGIQIPDKNFISSKRPCCPGLGVTGPCWLEYPSRSAVQDFNSETSSNIQVDQWSDAAEQERNIHCPRYVRLISKQMVGIYVSIWVHQKLRRHINNVKVSPVGVGLMGYVRNKGSVSVSMSLFQTELCFVCSHLTSGQKDGHKERRNRDVSKILQRTEFPSATDAEQPKTIFSHNQIFWFGDLNYRLDMDDMEVRQLVAERRWDELINNDQLCREMEKGLIFDGWKEGRIDFAPTYKYEFNSDKYAGQDAKEGEKRRSPAWCDRILWFGKGIRQISYTRAELRLSDHRPVSSMFLLEVDVLNRQELQVERVLNLSCTGSHSVDDLAHRGTKIDASPILMSKAKFIKFVSRINPLTLQGILRRWLIQRSFCRNEK